MTRVPQNCVVESLVSCLVQSLPQMARWGPESSEVAAVCSFVQSFRSCLWSACYVQSPRGEAWHSTRDCLRPGRHLSLPDYNLYMHIQSETEPGWERGFRRPIRDRTEWKGGSRPLWTVGWRSSLSTGLQSLIDPLFFQEVPDSSHGRQQWR